MTSRDSLDSCSYCSPTVNKGTEAAFGDLHNEIIEECRLQKGGSRPGTHSVLFVDHGAETEVLTNPYSVLQFLEGLGTGSYIFCNICWLLVGQGCLQHSTSQSWVYMTSDILLFIILGFCVSVYKLFSNLKFVFVVALMLESYKNRSIN